MQDLRCRPRPVAPRSKASCVSGCRCHLFVVVVAVVVVVVVAAAAAFAEMPASSTVPPFCLPPSELAARGRCFQHPPSPEPPPAASASARALHPLPLFVVVVVVVVVAAAAAAALAEMPASSKVPPFCSPPFELAARGRCFQPPPSPEPPPAAYASARDLHPLPQFAAAVAPAAAAAFAISPTSQGPLFCSPPSWPC